MSNLVSRDTNNCILAYNILNSEMNLFLYLICLYDWCGNTQQLFKGSWLFLPLIQFTSQKA